MANFVAVLVFSAGLLSVLSSVYSEQCHSCIDLTRTNGSTGTAVVLSTIDVLFQSSIFPDDSNFLRRVAYLVSQDGDVSNDGGGIWAVPESIFDATVSGVNASTDAAILSDLGISWREGVQYSDLSVPLYSALALRIYLEITYLGVDFENISNQVLIWYSIYSSYGDADFFTTSIGNIDVYNTTGKG